MSSYSEMLNKKFVRDGVWLALSQVLLALCGLLINVLLTREFEVAGFGHFSLGLKVYLIVSLLAVFGCGSSMVKHVAQYKKEPEMLKECINSAMHMGLYSSLFFTLIAWAGVPLIVNLFDEPELAILYWFLPGIPLFTVNKILSGILNGMRSIKALALIQGLRWIVLTLFIIYFIYFGKNELEMMALAFGLTELILLPIGIRSTKKYYRFTFRPSDRWLRRHFSFGGQSMLSTALIDLYNYADVFMLGYFLNAQSVGLYVFASDIAKNLLALANIIQVNFNPIISELWHKNKITQLKAHMKRIRKLSFLIYLPLIVFSIAGYYLFIQYFMEKELMESMFPFTILSAGILLLALFKPFFSLPELTGHPGDNLLINIIVLVLNIILNYAFIFVWDINGVAMATVFSYLFSILLLYIFVKRRLSINIFN